jgi:hypothetical protein
MANDVKHHCAASQYDFRCILIHIGRLESQGKPDFIYVEKNDPTEPLESDDDSENGSSDGTDIDEASERGYGSDDSDESESSKGQTRGK